MPQIALSVSSEGYNALHLAVSQHQTQVARLLVDKQVKWSRRTRHLASSGPSAVPLPHMEGSNGGGGGGNGIENSLSHGAARFATPTMSGHTVLHFAVAVNDTESLSFLLKYHRELQLPVDSAECGYTPLHLAVFLNRMDAVRMLLQKGASPNTRIEQGVATSLSVCRTPLAEAALNKNAQVVQCLLEHGAEDRQREAIKKCVPYNRHGELVVPILASMIRHDDTYKPTHKEHRSRQRYVSLEWANLSLPEFLSHWVLACLSKAPHLRSVDPARLTECVTCVNLSGNQLYAVPAELFQLPKMTLLNLSGNRLEMLPKLERVYSSTEDFDPWPCNALTKLNLSKNALKELPEFIFALPKLVHLDLSYNQLRELPFDLWRAPKLHTFLCTHNELEAIPTNWPHILNTITVVDSSTAPKSLMEVCVCVCVETVVS